LIPHSMRGENDGKRMDSLRVVMIQKGKGTLHRR